MAIEDVIASSSLTVEPILTLLDQSLVEIKDISDETHSLVISHDNASAVSGRIQFRAEGAYQWNTLRVKVELQLTGIVNGVSESYTTSMGVYVPQTPADSDRTESPTSFDVEAFSPTYIYKSPRANSHNLDSGSNYLTAVQALIDEVGWPSSFVDQSATLDTTPADFVWLLEDSNTQLKIINDLLFGINYQTLYSGRNGRLIAEPYVFPQDKAPTWTFTDSETTSIITDPVVQSNDWAEVPNRWVFILDDPTQPLPSEANGGIYIVTNEDEGVTSKTSRGYYKTAIIPLDFLESPAAMVAAADRIVSRSKLPIDEVSLTTTPNPLIWHHDVVELNTPTYGITSKYYVESWSMDLTNLRHSFSLKKVPLL